MSDTNWSNVGGARGQRGERFFLCKVTLGDEVAYIFATDSQIRYLASCKRLSGDGKFQLFYTSTDFEKAAINAFQFHFPGARIVGCNFHFGQANFKNLALHLKVEYEVDHHICHVYVSLTALAFIPLDDQDAS